MEEPMIVVIIALFFGFAFLLGYGVAAFQLGRKRFIVKTNEKGETTIEPLERPKQKMEFLPEIDRKEEEEMERPTGMQKFLGGFKKSSKQEEEEEEV